MATVGEKMTAIANAIRKKTGGTAKLTLDTMASSLNNIPERTSSNLSASGATVTVPAGNYKTQATKSVATVGRADTTISVSADDTNDKLTITASNNQGTGYVTGANKTATKTITLTASGSSVTASDGTNKVSKSVATATQATPSISVNSSGLITASAKQTAGYVAAGTKSATKQLTTKAATTITPGTRNQTVAAGTYLTGALTIAGDADLVAANIVSGKNIFGVAGSYSGMALNFNVVGGTTKPSNPTENTIWVNTSTAITSWVFDAPPAPTGSAGMVWFEISTSSTIYFNTIKSNNITVYPVSCKQYISNSWVEKSIEVYQSGSWKSLWAGELYKNGNEYEGITGGWTYTKLPGFNKENSIADSINHDPTITKNSTNISMKPSGISSFSVHTTKKIDLTKYNTLTFTGSCVNPAYDSYSTCRMSIKTLIAPGYYSTDNVVSYKVVSNTSAIVNKTGTITLDISAISGEHYISFDFWTHNFELKMESLILS